METSPIVKFTEVILDPTKEDVFTNAHPVFQAPGQPGIFGGATLAHALSAAQKTTSSDFDVHSMHCVFLSAGNAEYPIYYHVRRLREGRTFATRIVEARQRGKTICTATISFARSGLIDMDSLRHAMEMPADVSAPPDMESGRNYCLADNRIPPFENIRYPLIRFGKPTSSEERQWFRARSRISETPQAHQSALVYLSDTYFVGAMGRVHNIKGSSSSAKRSIESKLRAFPGTPEERTEMQTFLEGIHFGSQEMSFTEQVDSRERVIEEAVPTMEWNVSLTHTMYFHRPRTFRADEWMFAETKVPWTGDSRALVTQYIWSKDGQLIATCLQEGFMKLRVTPQEKL